MKKGFTLLELLVVIIIVGVLAAVAMPNLMRNVELSKATEALTILGNVARQVDACVGSYTSSVDGPVTTAVWDNCRASVDGAPLSSDTFIYVYGSSNSGGTVSRYQFFAIHNVDNSSTITFTRNYGTGTGIIKSGTGYFASIR